MSKLLWIIPLTIVVLFAIFIPGINKENIFILGGSTSVYNVWNKIDRLDIYKKLGYKIQYNSIGSSAALKRVHDGIFDIGYSSYDKALSNDDKLIIQKKTIATDYLVLVYNLPKQCQLKPTAENKFILISKAKIKSLFMQETPIWNDLRSNIIQNYDCSETIWKQKISRIIRENGSGTRLSFEKFFDFKTIYNFNHQIKSTNQLIKTLKNDSGSFTYFSLSFLNNEIINKAVKNQLGIFIIKENPQIKFVFDYPNNDIKSNIALINKLKGYDFKNQFVGFYLKKNHAKLKKLFAFIKLKKFQNALYRMRLKPNND